MFEGVWGNVDSKAGFQRQSVTKNMRLTLFFTWNSALQDKFSLSFFVYFFARINKIFILAVRLHTRVSSMKFRPFPEIS